MSCAAALLQRCDTEPQTCSCSCSSTWPSAWPRDERGAQDYPVPLLRERSSARRAGRGQGGQRGQVGQRPRAHRWAGGLPAARAGRGGCPLPAMAEGAARCPHCGQPPRPAPALGRALGLARRVLGRTRRIPRAAPSAPPPSCWPTQRGLKLDGIAMPFSSQFFCEPVQFTTRGQWAPPSACEPVRSADNYLNWPHWPICGHRRPPFGKKTTKRQVTWKRDHLLRKPPK